MVVRQARVKVRVRVRVQGSADRGELPFLIPIPAPRARGLIRSISVCSCSCSVLVLVLDSWLLCAFVPQLYRTRHSTIPSTRGRGWADEVHGEVPPLPEDTATSRTDTHRTDMDMDREDPAVGVGVGRAGWSGLVRVSRPSVLPVVIRLEGFHILNRAGGRKRHVPPRSTQRPTVIRG